MTTNERAIPENTPPAPVPERRSRVDGYVATRSMPQLGRGLLWSDMVADIERDQAIREARAA